MLPSTPDAGWGRTDARHVTPVERDDLGNYLVNLRSGRLELNTLYGDEHGDFSKDASNKPILDPHDPAQMIVPRWSTSWVDRPSLARHLGGDPRDCSNLIIQQLRLALILLHNRIARACDVQSIRACGRERVFEWARRELRHVYQWLVVNDLVRRLCGSAMVDEVMQANAPLYRGFLDSLGGGIQPCVPVEFFAAAFRFGHSMVRSSYDCNSVLGRPGQDARNVLRSAPLGLLLKDHDQFSDFLSGDPIDLEETFRIDWSRLTGLPSADYPDRSTRKIDSRISAAMAEPTANWEGLGVGRAHLARRNLRRGYQLNLTSGQAAVAETNRRLGTRIEPLSQQELCSGPTGSTMRSGSLTEHTPLWFYILKEAEIRGEGERLGPLGARLVAETIVGLVVADPTSYWHRGGSVHRRWHPSCNARLLGATVTSFADLLRSAEAS